MGFILKEVIHPKVMARKFVTATVAYVPPDVSLGKIGEALDRFAEVVSLTELHVRDFPEIKSRKQQAILKPRGAGLPSYFPVRNFKASLFFTGCWLSGCLPAVPTEGTDHLGRDCTRKNMRQCF